jgi:hypothetical protein
VQTIFIYSGNITVNVYDDLFIGAGIIETVCPEAVICRDADKVETLRGYKFKLFKTGFFGQGTLRMM